MIESEALPRGGAATTTRPLPAPGAPASTAGRGSFSALRSRDFRFLLAGTMGANMAMWIQTIAQSWIVLQLTGSAVALGAISFVRGIAMLLASPVGGLLSDKFDRRLMMNGATALSAVSASLLAVAVVTGHITIWQLFLFAGLDGLLSSINQPARTALVYDVAGPADLTNAVALQSIGQNVMRLVGPSLGGALIGFAGVGACFAAQAGFYVISVLLSLPIRARLRTAMPVTTLKESLLGGFRYARGHRPVLLLLVVAALPSLFVYPYMSFMSLITRDVLHANALWFGVLITAVGVGSIGGAFLAAGKAATFRRKGVTMLALTILYMVMVGFFALSHWYALSYGLLIIAGFANSIYLTINNSLLQLATTDEYRGRVSGLYFMTGGLQPFGSLALGALIAVIGPQPSVALFCFIAAALTGLLWFVSPRLRAM